MILETDQREIERKQQNMDAASPCETFYYDHCFHAFDGILI